MFYRDLSTDSEWQLRWIRSEKPIAIRRIFSQEFKQDAVQMLLDGHTASSIVERLGISGTNILYRWKKEQLASSGPIANAMDSKLRELENELRRVERERDILKKALSIVGRSE